MIGRIVALIALLAAAPAIAQTPEGEARAHAAPQLDPGRSYVVFRGFSHVTLSLLRRPVEADWPGYRKARAAAMEKQLPVYRRRMEEWRYRAKKWRELSPRMQARRREPVGPVYPTEATIDYPPIEMTLMIRLSPQPVDGQDMWTAELQPGTYTLYGSIGPGEFGYSGYCLCMGSVEFDVGADQIVDLGEVIQRNNPTDPPQRGELQAGSLTIAPVTAVQSDAFRAEPRWKRAEYRPVGMIPNALGVRVERLGPMPGILAYRRGVPIDARDGSAAPLGLRD